MFEKIKRFLFKNTTAKQTVAKNTIWLGISNFGGRLIKAGVIIYAARILGTSGYGVFSYAVTLAGFLTLFMDPGINGILIRDASKAPDEKRRVIFGTALVIKLFLLFIGVAIIIFVAPLFTTLPGAKVLLPIVAIILALDTIREFFFSLIRAMEKMEKEAGIFLLTNLGILAFGFLFLYIARNVESFSWGYVVGDAIGTATAVFVLRDYLKKVFSQFDGRLVLPLLQAAWPFAISGVLGLLFTNIDILIISWIRSASEVGIYSAAIRIIQTLYLIPGIIQFTILPLLSRLAKKDDTKFRTVLERTLGIIFLTSIPLALGGMLLGSPIMELIFGGPYRTGGLAFDILMVTLLFDFPASILINALFAYDHQKTLIISSALGGAVNVILDFALIPSFGIAGSAAATLIAQIVNNGYLWFAMKKINYFKVLPQLWKVIMAGVIMAAGTLGLMLTGVHLIFNIIISAAIYCLLLKILREPLLKELVLIVMPSKAKNFS
jgi:O-antigen/teichoic acid export membrane protein